MYLINGKKILNTVLTSALLCSCALGVGSSPAIAEKSPPPLIISNEPLPPELHSNVYSKPAQTRTIFPSDVLGANYYGDSSETIAGRKVDDIRSELFSVQSRVAGLSELLASLEQMGQAQAAEYYASVATISTQLQSGTTPGNPRLVKKLSIARDNLETLSSNIAALNDLAIDISNVASMSSFLLESARATYGLSGAIEEDHVRLAQLEDAINNTIVVIDRLLNNVSDDITRTTAYVGSERTNLRTLSLAIRTGDLFGKSLSNRPFSHALPANLMPAAVPVAPVVGGDGLLPTTSPVMPAPAVLSEPRPLAKIRFDRANVMYEQPVYMAVNEALARFPNARFELVAVHPDRGNAAEVAIESTRARRNAERVLRSLTEMGLSLDQIDLSYMPSHEASTNEVHLYIR